MKSKKAKEAIDNYYKTFGRPCIKNDIAREYCRLFGELAEIAEQEAEERMKAKAVEAHRECCFFRNGRDNDCANTGTACGEHICFYMSEFSRKLNEE